MSDPVQKKALETKKLELLVKIKEHEHELQKVNLELYKHGVDIGTVMCW
jgi:hypothetical protein